MSKQGTLITVAGNQEGSNLKIVTPSDPFPVYSVDSQHDIIDEVFHADTAISTTVKTAVVAGDTSVDVVSVTGFIVGSIIDIGDTDSTHAQVTVITGTVLTLDRPLDHSHAIGETVNVIIIDISTTAGTLASPVSFKVFPDAGYIWHVFGITIAMVHGTAADDSLFGGIAALANGLVFRERINNGSNYHTISNWKNNRDIHLDVTDLYYTAKSGGGLYGSHGKWDFGVSSVSLELDSTTNDYLELLVQDNITGLTSFEMSVRGYVEKV